MTDRFNVVPRLNGDRYVRGAIRYLDDADQGNCLHVAFTRSPHAHALIKRVDLTPALGAPGVTAAVSGVEAQHLIGDLISPLPEALTGAAGQLTVPCLPLDRVRFVGEPVAVVVADTELAARRAAELVDIVYEPLPPMLDIATATRPGAPRQHPMLPTNVLSAGSICDGDMVQAMGDAPYTSQGELMLGRCTAVPLEPRGCIATWQADDERLIVRAATQQPHTLRADLARQLRLPESDIQVIAAPLGGSFGFKFPGLPEEPLTCLMALHTGRPVRWVESRAESLLVGAREYHAHYRVGFESSGRVTALSVDIDANVGALYGTPGPAMPTVAAGTFPGGYDIADFEIRWRAVMTNKGPWNGARAFGKELAIMVMETAVDDVARSLDLDPVEVRRRNLLRAEQLPHCTASMTLDSGDYHKALDMVLALADYPALRARQRRQPPDSTTRFGIGIAFELSPEGIDYAGTLARVHETATVRLDTSGHVTVLSGATSPGTGSETAIAQLVGTQLGINPSTVRVVQGDTDRTPYGAGSFSSRAVLAGGTAAWLAARDLRAQLINAARTLLQAPDAQIEVADGLYYVADEPTRAIPIGALAVAIRTLGGALPGLDGLQLEITSTYRPKNIQAIPDQNGRVQQYPTYPYSVCVASVVVDVETGCTGLEMIAVVHDCGTVINPPLVDAQMHGAIAMGVGIALHEEQTYTDDGGPRSSSFKTYRLPRLQDMPELRIGHLVSPSPFTELGTKGAGDGGVSGSVTAIVGAIRDAIGPSKVALHTPMTPARVLAYLDGAEKVEH
jgi:carbon-monoxide dehydrogenase large subunit